MGNPISDWLFRVPCLSRYMATNKTRQIKEELMAAAWHPRRVAAWLEGGGWDLVDAM